MRVRKTVSGIALIGLGIGLAFTAAAPASAAPDRKYGAAEPVTGSSEADAVNDNGVVAATSWFAVQQPPKAFTWNNGFTTNLGTGLQARAIANNGHVGVNIVGGPDRPTHAGLWVDGRLTDLGTLGGTNSHVEAMNDRDQVVGYSDLPDGRIAAFLWQNGRMTALASPYGSSVAHDINAHGEIVGWATDRAEKVEGAVWLGGFVTFVGPAGFDAVAVNDGGDIVGNTFVGADLHAYLWRRGVVTDLGSLGYKGPDGTSYTRADDITNDGLIAGDSYGADGVRHVFVWNAGGFTDLGQGVAVGITATGTVAGNTEGGGLGLVWRPLP
jgi:probable HAF family extracellular repeat protein